MGTTLQKPDGVFQRVTLFFTLYPKDDKRIISYPIDTLSDTKIRDSSPKSEDEHPFFLLERSSVLELGFAIGSNPRSDVLFFRGSAKFDEQAKEKILFPVAP